MIREKLPNHDEWLAAEYALGVLSNEPRLEAQKRFETEPAFRAAVEGWQNQLEPLLDDVDEVAPPASVLKAVEAEIGISAEAAYAQVSTSGVWKWLTGASTAVAAACVAALVYVTGGDITGNTIADVRNQLQSSSTKVVSLSRELESAQATAAFTAGELDAVRQQIASVIAEREGSFQQVAALESELEKAQRETLTLSSELSAISERVSAAVPLVASLTKDGDVPAFIAQYDPLKRSLLIRTSANNDDEKVPEIWFIPETGSKKGEVLSLGVMNEAAPDQIVLTDEFIPWMDEGGTLAITMEQAGGSPTGVATGPIIAVGKLQALR